MRISLLTAAVVVIVVAAGAGPAGAQCPVVSNGTFATNVSGWHNFATWDGSLGNPIGSDMVGPINAGGSTMCGDSLSTCTPVTPGASCDAAAQAYVAPGQPTGGSGQLGYLFFTDAGCTTILSASAEANVLGSQQGTWVPLDTGPVTVPAGAVAAEVVLNVCAPPGTSMTINWDNVVSGAYQQLVPTLSAGALALFGALLAAAGLLALRGLRG